jgi:hypothetical protein
MAQTVIHSSKTMINNELKMSGRIAMMLASLSGSIVPATMMTRPKSTSKAALYLFISNHFPLNQPA